MKRGVVIAIIIIFAVIIIGVVSFLIYKSSQKKSKKELDALKAQLLALQSQASNPNTPPQQKQTLLSQIADITKTLQDSGVIKGGENKDVNVNANTNVQVVQPSGYPLKKGMGSRNNPNQLVINLQKGLNTKCSANLVPDGAFGSLTEGALEKCYGVKEADYSLFLSITQ